MDGFCPFLPPSFIFQNPRPYRLKPPSSSISSSHHLLIHGNFNTAIAIIDGHYSTQTPRCILHFHWHPPPPALSLPPLFTSSSSPQALFLHFPPRKPSSETLPIFVIEKFPMHHPRFRDLGTKSLANNTCFISIQAHYHLCYTEFAPRTQCSTIDRSTTYSSVITQALPPQLKTEAKVTLMIVNLLPIVSP